MEVPKGTELGLIDRILPPLSFEDNEDREDLTGFPFSDFDLSEINSRFFEFLKGYFPLIRCFYQDENGQDFRRKVNGGLYLRHILRAMVWGEALFDELVRQGLLLENDYSTFMLSIALHDALEIVSGRTKEWFIGILKNNGINKEEAQRIGKIVSILTPAEKTVDEEDTEAYLTRKRRDFQRVVNVRNKKDKMPLLVKITDILANMDETIDDLRQGRENGQMRPLGQRYLVFRERIKEIEKIFGERLELVELLKLKEKLRIIEDFLFWNLKDDVRMSKEEEIILRTIQENRSFEYEWQEQKSRCLINGLVIINGEVYLVKRTNGNTLEILRFEDLIRWQELNYPSDRVPEWIILRNDVAPDFWTNDSFPPPPFCPEEKMNIDSNSIAGKRLNAIAELS